MDDRRGSLDLSEEIELCGKLRNDIGKALKADAHNAAKAQSESEENRTLETLIEKEVLHLKGSVAAAETSFLRATGSIEKIEVATAHLHETNYALSQQLDTSLQLIDKSTEAFEELRRRHLSFCQVQEEAHKRMTSVEALLRTIIGGEDQTRSLKTELQTLRSALEVLDRTREELTPVLRSCQEDFGCIRMEYEQSKKNNGQHLELIGRCREEEEQMKARMKQLRDEHTQLCQRKAALEAEVTRVQNAVAAEVKGAQQQQREMEEKQMKSSTLSDDKKRAREDQQRKSDLLTEEMRKATEEMYSTMERMKELRKQDTELAQNKLKATAMLKHEGEVFLELKNRGKCTVEFRAAQQKAASVTETLLTEEKQLNGLCGMLEVARMEQTEMDALCEREKTVLSSSLEVLQTAEKEADEATEVGEELKGLLGALDAILTEQKEISSTLVLSRSRVDLQLKNADIADVRLHDIRHAQGALTKQVEERVSNMEKDEALLEQLYAKTSQQNLEAGTLEQEHAAIHRNIEELQAKLAESHKDENTNDNESETELSRLREELQTKYEAACAQIRVECRSQYTAMLNQTLKDEEEKLAEEKRSKVEQISVFFERTTGKTASINAYLCD